MTTEGIDVHSVGNTLVLQQTALIEAFNLKAAIEYQLKNCKNLSRWHLKNRQMKGEMSKRFNKLSFKPGRYF